MTKKSSDESNVIYAYVIEELSRIVGTRVTDAWSHVIDLPAPHDWHFYTRVSTSGFWALSPNKADEVSGRYPGRWSILLIDGRVKQMHDESGNHEKVVLNKIYNITPSHYDERRALWTVVGREYRINDGKGIEGTPSFASLKQLVGTINQDLSLPFLNSKQENMVSASRNMTEIVGEFKAWLQTENAQQHLKKIENEKKEVQDMMKKLDSMDKSSPEFIELVLYGLLPYAKTKKAKRVSTFPVFFDIKQFFEGYQYNDSDWAKIAHMVYSLAHRFQQEPDKLNVWIKEFISDRTHSRSLQCGSISPILFCINDSYPLVNNRIRHTYKELSRILNWDETMSQKLEDYLDNIQKCNKLIETLGDPLFANLAVFDLFCWWYDINSRRKKVIAVPEEEEEDEEPESEGTERVQIQEISYPTFLQSLHLEAISKYEPHKLRNPDTITIRDIITYCSTGKWMLPKFQRYFGWKKSDVKDFLASIFDDYYVGALLLWGVEGESPLEPMPISGVTLSEDYRMDAIILDGQQRITSLYYAIRAPEDVKLKGSGKPVYFYIDFQNFLKNGESKDNIKILKTKISREESFNRLLFPFYELENYRKWVEELLEFMRRASPDSDSLQRIVTVRQIIDDKLSHFISGFEIPYVTLPHSMQIDQVTDIFEKINSTGIELSVFDLLNARLSKRDIELRDLFDETQKQYRKISEYNDKKDKMAIYILQAIMLYYNKTSSCKREDILNIHKNISREGNPELEDLWKEMSDCTHQAISKLENLRDGYGVKDSGALPFSPMIPILAALVREITSNANKAECYKKLDRWYWSAVFSNAYSGSVDSRLTADFRDMRTWFSDDSTVPKSVDDVKYSIPRLDLKNVHQKSSAVYRGVLSLLALEGALDFDTSRTLENATGNDKHHIFPKSTFKNFSDIDSILNMTWMSDETNRKVIGAKRPSKYVKDFIEEKYGGSEQKFIDLLQTHLISRDAYECMMRDDFEGFLKERENEIVRRIIESTGVSSAKVPATMLTPETPFTNRLIYEDAIKSCSVYVHWVDKYFNAEGLRLLSDAVNKKRVKEIKVLMSLEKADERFRSRFKDFRDEMKAAGIICSVRVMVDSKITGSFHDRWIMSQSKNFNIPSPDTLARKQFSEIKETTNKVPFGDWWNKSPDIIDDWNAIQRSRTKA